MRITVFEKGITTKDGKHYNLCVSNLPKKDGSSVYAVIRFKEGKCKAPETFPAIIDIAHTDANLSVKKTVNAETGEVYTNHTLWVNKWTDSGEQFRDTTLDEFEE